MMSSTRTHGLEMSILVSLEADGEHSFLEESGLDEVISTHRGFKDSCCMAVTATVAMGLSLRPVSADVTLSVVANSVSTNQR